MKLFGFEVGGSAVESAPNPEAEMETRPESKEEVITPLEPGQIEDYKKAYIKLSKEWIAAKDAFSRAVETKTLHNTKAKKDWLSDEDFSDLGKRINQISAALKASGVDMDAIDEEAGFQA